MKLAVIILAALTTLMGSMAIDMPEGIRAGQEYNKRSARRRNQPRKASRGESAAVDDADSEFEEWMAAAVEDSMEEIISMFTQLEEETSRNNVDHQKALEIKHVKDSLQKSTPKALTRLLRESYTNDQIPFSFPSASMIVDAFMNRLHRMISSWLSDLLNMVWNFVRAVVQLVVGVLATIVWGVFSVVGWLFGWV